MQWTGGVDFHTVCVLAAVTRPTVNRSWLVEVLKVVCCAGVGCWMIHPFSLVKVKVVSMVLARVSGGFFFFLGGGGGGGVGGLPRDGTTVG